MDLKLEGWIPGVKLHSGRIYFKEDRSEWIETYFHLPRADLEGELRVGGMSIPLRGDAYVDHIVQNVLGTDYSTRWWTLRHFAPDHTVAFLVYRTPKELGGELVTHLLITDRKRLLSFGTEMELRTSAHRKDPKGHRYATRFDISYKGKGLALDGKVVGKQLHDRDAVLDRLSWVERKVAGLVAGNPLIYRLVAEPELRLLRQGQPEIVLRGAALIENVVLKEEEEEKE